MSSVTEVNKMIKLILLFAAVLPIIQPKVYFLQPHDFEDNTLESSDPPSHDDHAKMARWLVHNADWTSMGTISTLPAIAGFPMVNVIAVADSVKDAKSTGEVYFYLTMKDFTAQDLSKKNTLTALFSMDQSLYCSKRNIDPMEPTCARLMISGEALRIPKNTEEYEFATAAMLSHHPASANWVSVHDFFLCKLSISSICILDWYGGPHFVTPEDYFSAELESDKDFAKKPSKRMFMFIDE